MTESITELEIELAHQSRQIEDLSDMVQRQWDEIDMLKKKLGRADARIADLEEYMPEPKANEKPPHY